MGGEVQRILGDEEPEKEPDKKPPEKPAESRLPEEIDKLQGRLDKLAGEFTSFKKLANEFTSFRDSITKTVESLTPEEKVPCPGCETLIPKSKVEEIHKRLEQQAPTKEVIREVPKIEIKEVEVPRVPYIEYTKTVKEAFPERPSDEVVGALENVAKVGERAGWLKK